MNLTLTRPRSRVATLSHSPRRSLRRSQGQMGEQGLGGQRAVFQWKFMAPNARARHVQVEAERPVPSMVEHTSSPASPTRLILSACSGPCCWLNN